VVLSQIIELVKAGTLGGEAFAINLANGGEVIELNSGYTLSPDVETLVGQTIEGVIDGSIKIQLPE